MKRVSIINGPNLNLLGKREPKKYGNQSFIDYFEGLKLEFSAHFDLSYFQTNIEGEIIDKLHEIGFDYDAIILNAGGYTHTSVAIRDAIAAIDAPVVEVHITNIYARESFRQNSLLSPVCFAGINGFGLKSYHLALQSFL